MSSTMEEDSSILDKLDAAVPVPLAQFDAFPKLPSTYKSRSESRGFMTLFVAFLAFLLMLNDLGEFIWGWPDYEFSVDKDMGSFMNVNVDLIVNMPCRYLNVDLRDAVGDRLFLNKGLRRDGTLFDANQATAFKAHSDALSVRQAVKQSRSSRGLFSFFSRSKDGFKPTVSYKSSGNSACRIWGSLEVKKVTANLHITTLGHGYASREHVDHSKMNLSHVITEFSFGPHFPDITQPLDYSYETTSEPFVAYQYFLHVVPTTYIAPRSSPLRTHQYSVTHYTRVLDHNKGTPGIFFKFDLDPLSLTIHQRTTTFIQLIIRCVGVIGGVFVCMGYAIRITTRAVEVVSGADSSPGLVAAESSGVKVGLRQKWGGGTLRSRNSGKLVRQGTGWTLEGESPYGSYAGTPVSGGFGSPQSPYLSPGPPPSAPGTPNPKSGLGFAAAGGGSSAFGPSSPSYLRSPPAGPPRTPSLGAPRTANGGLSPGYGFSTPSSPLPGTPAYANFPPTPNPVNGRGFPGSPNPSGIPPPPPRVPKKDD